ncbi:DNAH6 [Symbiodinium necroappetens]|uniref:DNAH6 protein n=1 Tax=Symbiodinium necroappetens TaxID=1628268 RepID=A0A812MH33_9DINO|nr:DNAH6 [Symbiodinium necroappetens]CAE7464869.1 DNAH6 [Symbiodinium sp. KB8]
MLTTFISPQHGFKLEEGREGKATQAENKHEKVLARIYCAFSAVWSLGANLHEASRKKFQDFLRAPLQMFCPEVGDQDRKQASAGCQHVSWICVKHAKRDAF